MAEVITLSDDDDVIPLTAPSPAVLRTSSSANHANGNGTGATVHISTVTKLNLEQLGIKQLSDVYSRNQALLRGNGNSNIPRGIRTAPNPAVQQVQAQLGRRNLKRASPGAPHASVASTSTQRTRNNQNSSHIPQLYNGHYMFEATETYEPSRRSTRFNTKKIEGKFMCTYNQTKCYKLCATIVDFINHIWAHVIFDAAPVLLSNGNDGSNESFMRLANSAPLSNNSKMALRKMQTCEFCNAVFKTVYMKQQHVVKCHLEQDSLDSTCNICELDFETAPGFEAHMRKHVAGESPYNCQKCKYRTSVRSFFYQHFIEKHANDALLCPICLYQEDLRPSTRRSKHIYVRGFVEHMRRHSVSPQFRCHACALCFSDRPALEHHRTHDHTLLNTLWQVVERTTVREDEREKMSKRHKIGLLQRKFFETAEGRRINDEVVCAGNKERTGYDLTSTGNKLYKCNCGFNSWNGNRTASHYHRCRQAVLDIERERDSIRNDKDPDAELEIFAVYPPLTNSEAHNLEIAEKNLQTEKDNPIKIRTQTMKIEPIDDTLMLKMIESEKSVDIIEKCFANLIANDE